MKITAAQHVSAMLTSKESPKGRAGYQTLYYTHDLLSEDEVRTIERLVQYSSARESRPKWQWYRLSPGRHGITRIIPIRDLDDVGRGGRYFTHSLICDVPEAANLDASLLDLLRPQDFFSTLKAVLASPAMRSGSAPALTFDLQRESVADAIGLLRNWSGEELNRLCLLMSDQRRLTDQGQYVGLLGSDEQILEALKVAFLLTPPADLQFCSFDTNPVGGAFPPNGPFWGRAGRTATEASHVIDAARRQVVIPKTSPLLQNSFPHEELSPSLRECVAAQLSRPSDIMLRSLLDHRYEAFLGEAVYQVLLHETKSLAASDVQLLSTLARAHDELALLLTLESGDNAERLRALSALSDSSYEKNVSWLKRHSNFKPWQVFSPRSLSTWFYLFRNEYSQDDLTKAITIVTDHGSDSDRDHLREIADHLKEDERRALGAWLKSSRLRLSRLQTALDRPTSGVPGGKARRHWRRLVQFFKLKRIRY